MAGKKLLVADDSLTIQKVIRLALSNEGYEIQAVSDGNDAIQQISLFRPDVILIDVSLPGKTAFEVKRAVNELTDLEEVRFVLMSSAFEKVDEAQADEVKFHGRLTKPFDPAHLRQVLTDALYHGRATLPPPPEIFPPPALPFEEEDDLPSAPDEPSLHTPSRPSPTQSPSEPDSDIRHLTESTIRMSGLDDFQWSVNEPSLKPPGLLPDSGGASFQIEPPIETSMAPFPPFRPDFVPEISGVMEASPDPVSEPSITNLAPPPADLGAAASPSDFYRDPADITKKLSRPPVSTYSTEVMPISQDQMEEIMRKQLQETFQKLAEKILPEMAERLIKQEIHRMLSET